MVSKASNSIFVSIPDPEQRQRAISNPSSDVPLISPMIYLFSLAAIWYNFLISVFMGAVFVKSERMRK
jgi:hypothetical protein